MGGISKALFAGKEWWFLSMLENIQLIRANLTYAINNKRRRYFRHMKNALYMNNSYIKEFEATVENVKDDKYVTLDKTAFYPPGGGQPHDTGIMA